MPALKITKRLVDPITFHERWGGQFVPRLEDFMLDQTIASSMSYGPQPVRAISSPPPVESQQSPTTSQSKSPRSRKKSNPLSSIQEHSDHSLSELSAVHSIGDVEQAVEDHVKMRNAGGGTGVRFADEVEMNEISRLRDSVIAEIFYESEDLANFRYEAFMEEAGLDPTDYE